MDFHQSTFGQDSGSVQWGAPPTHPPPAYPPPPPQQQYSRAPQPPQPGAPASFGAAPPPAPYYGQQQHQHHQPPGHHSFAPPPAAPGPDYGQPSYGHHQPLPQQPRAAGASAVAGIASTMLTGGAPDTHAMVNFGLQFGEQMFQEHGGRERVGRALAFVEGLRIYFQVTNRYVLRRLKVLAFPFRSSFDRAKVPAAPGEYDYEPPARDYHGVDLYIPVMALVTYVMLSALIKGANNTFKPEVLGSQTSWAIAVVALEAIALKTALFIFGAQRYLWWLDATAFAGYKYFGVCICLALRSLIPPGWLWMVPMAWFALCAGFVLRGQLLEVFRRSHEWGPPPPAVPFLWACVAWQVPVFMLLVSGLNAA